MVIQHNIAAINSHRNLGINNSATNKNLEKLSSGFRINRAGDDAAGLAISEKMRGQIRGLAMAEQNTSNGISLIQTAEGGLNETHAILQRMRELAVQASNGTYQDEDRAQIQLEVTALKEEIDRISTSTHYNGIKLLNGNLHAGYDAITRESATLADLEIASIEVKQAVSDSTTVGEEPASIQGYKYEIAADEDGVIKATIYDSAGKLVNPSNYTISGNLTGDGLTAETITIKFTGTGGSGSGAGKADAELILKTNAAYTLGTTFELTGTIGAEGIGDTGNAAATAAVSGTQRNFSIEILNGEDLIFQIGANGTADQQVSLEVRDMGARAIGIVDAATNTINMGDRIYDINLSTRESANHAIKVIDAATNMVSSQRAELGALQNRLEHTLNNLGVTKENLTAAESTIRDVDMAKEMMEFTKNSILVQASQAMLAQANQLPQGVLSLLR